METNDNAMTTTALTSGQNAFTMASGAVGNYGGAYQQGCMQFWPEWPYTNPYPTTYYLTQPWCSGNHHVWACDHAETCKCGKATREPPACPHCGKAHA